MSERINLVVIMNVIQRMPRKNRLMSEAEMK